MKTLLAVALLVPTLSFAGMRCSNDLILEGDSVTKMVSICGQPDGYGQSLTYINKDSDGMNYYIHANAAGIIDNIQFSRSGLR